MVNILYHHRTAADDGQAVHIRELQAAFARAGHALREVAIVKRSNTNDPHARSLLGRVADALPSFVREWMEHAYDIAGARALRAEIHKHRPDFIYERYALSTACGARVSAEFKIPFVLEVNSPLVDEVTRTRGLVFQEWARKKEDFILSSAALVAVVSGELAKFVKSRGVPDSRIVLTPNGVEWNRYINLTKRTDLLDRWNVRGKRIVGFTGFVRDWHRLDLAFEAMAMKNLHKKNAIIMIVGEGPAVPKLEQRARELGIEEFVRFCGKVPHAEIQGYVALFDVALVTAINPYASPLKLFEYLAAGVATLVVDQPNLREIVTESSARFFPPNDVTALARALEELVTRPDVAAAIGAAGRALIRERDYTWDGNVRRIMAALEKNGLGLNNT
ncbi:MAG: glycosyltransferase [Planctomycetes bacterium]|nr:glycosyltransferase [Planctomycetota bacterium]